MENRGQIAIEMGQRSSYHKGKGQRGGESSHLPFPGSAPLTRVHTDKKVDVSILVIVCLSVLRSVTGLTSKI